MKIISVLQQKGGVGKTTIAVNLAEQLQQLYGLKVVIADADAGQHSSTVWAQQGHGSIIAHPVAIDGTGEDLRKELSAIKADVIIIDLPPALAEISMRAAFWSNLILIPVRASLLDLEAAKNAIELARQAIARDGTKRLLLVPAQVQLQTAVGRELRPALTILGPVSKAIICSRVAYVESPLKGVGVGSYAPGSIAHIEMGFLAEEVAEILNIKRRS
jgi:chromosome partitioning protein